MSSDARTVSAVQAAPAQISRPVGRRRLVLAGVELATGTAAVAGGALLIAAPDGSLLRADLSALAGSPFTDWRVPGALLAALVGGGFLAAGIWQRRRGRYCDELSMLAGLGLIVFELAEFGWIGFQPLEAVFAAVGAAIFLLAFSETTWTQPITPPTTMK